MQQANPMIAKFLTLYGEPKTGDVKDFLAEYATALKTYDKHTLKAAAGTIARTRMVSSWPTVGECLAACRDAEKLVKVQSFGSLEPIENFDGWYQQILTDIKHADNERDIEAAIERVKPYAIAKWCYWHRLETAQAAGDKRRSQLQSQRMTGERA